MTHSRCLLTLMLAASLAACGGGSAPPEPQAQPRLSISSAPIQEALAAGDELVLKLEGRISDAGTQPVFLQLRDSGAAFALPPIQALAADKSIALDVISLPSLAAGQRSGRLELRACKDAACAQPYDSAAASLAYELKVSAVADWETHQRDASHSGEVPIRLNPAKFSKAWEWKRPPGNEPIGGINPVVTKAGKVFVTTDVYFGDARLYALKEVDGSEAWSQAMGSVPAFNPPAVGGRKVYAAVTGHSQTFLWAFDLETGQLQHKSGFSGQWPHFLAPTVFDDFAYAGGGYSGAEVYSFSGADGSRKWTATVGGSWDMFTPAVDARHVYQHNAHSLVVIDRLTGTELARISDPAGNANGYSYHGAPMLGSRGNVIAFAGGAFSGRASANAEHYEQRKLSSFDIAGKKHEWSTADAYLTAPAVGRGVIYAARNNPMALDALDEATGKRLWTWTASGTNDTSFHRNVVLTRTHLFVSTNSNVYAIDLSTRQSVWSYPAPGMLAISADRTLYIATGARESDGRLVAIRLK